MRTRPPYKRSFLTLAPIIWLSLAIFALGQGGGGSVSDPEKIHQGDVVEIDEVGGFDFDWRGKLNPEGFLDGFTKIAEPIFARCRTPEEVAGDITREYAKILREPKVVVRILDRSDRALAYLDGAVKQPQRLRIKREVHLQELVVIGGGFTDKASGEITIFRPEGVSCAQAPDSARMRTIKISDILAGKPEANPKIISGDIVTIQAVQPVYLIGGVNNPGKTAWREGMTLSRAVAAAGGVSDRGVSGAAAIYRREGTSSRVLEADLGKIVAGQAQDIELKAFDIIDIPFKGAAKRRLPPVVNDPDARPTSLQTLPLRVID
ncbi:MAG TPA: SLBB domain-containing protein, partial [Pyrinomonadaceae bacterium]|nr:SLBB domain-containing protein [Pyrinomonadaceae bacterium]